MKIILSFGTSENPNMYQYLLDKDTDKYQIQDLQIFSHADFESANGGIGGESVSIRLMGKLPYDFLNKANVEPVYVGENRTEYNKKRFEASLQINKHVIILQNCASYTPEHLSSKSFSYGGMHMVSMLPNIAISGVDDIIKLDDSIISKLGTQKGFVFGNKMTLKELFKYTMNAYSLPYDKIDLSGSKDYELGEWVKHSGISLMKAMIRTIREYGFIISTSAKNGKAMYKLIQYEEFEKEFGRFEWDFNKMKNYHNLSEAEKKNQIPVDSLAPVFNSASFSNIARLVTKGFNQTVLSPQNYRIDQQFFGFNQNNVSTNTIYVTDKGLLNVSNEAERMRSAIRSSFVDGYKIDISITDPSAPYYKAGSVVHIKNYDFAYSKEVERNFGISITKFIIDTNELQITSNSYVQKLKLSPFIPAVKKT